MYKCCVANAALALVVLWGGFNLVFREHIGSPYHEAIELVPRVVLGALLVNTSLSWAQFAIDANNALCQVIGQTSLPAWDRSDAATQALVDVIAFKKNSTPELAPGIEFFTWVRRMTVDGFYTSRVGMRDIDRRERLVDILV